VPPPLDKLGDLAMAKIETAMDLVSSLNEKILALTLVSKQHRKRNHRDR